MVFLLSSLHTATVVDLDTLHWDILSALPSDPIATKYNFIDGQWSMDPNSFLLLDNRIYVPSTGNLHTYIFQYNHDHILSRHYGQNKTLELVCCRYSWPSLYADVILQVLCHLYMIQATTSQALQISQTTSYSWMTMKFYFYRLHQETSVIL